MPGWHGSLSSKVLIRFMSLKGAGKNGARRTFQSNRNPVRKDGALTQTLIRSGIEETGDGDGDEEKGFCAF
jgi:hypothetical protein